MAIAKVGNDAVSVSTEEVKPGDWSEKVYKPDILSSPGKLYKKPGYNPLEWRPLDASRRGLFERLHERLACDAWLVGRITGQEYAKLDAYPGHRDKSYPREPWIAQPDAATYGIVLDAHGKIAWGRADIGNDPIVVALTEKVSDAHLAGLRKDGVS
jgi:hypothetical protein